MPASTTSVDDPFRREQVSSARQRGQRSRLGMMMGLPDSSVRTKRRYRFVTLMQEVCGSWAGRKRLVAVISGGRPLLGLSRVVLAAGDWETWDVDK